MDGLNIRASIQNTQVTITNPIFLNNTNPIRNTYLSLGRLFYTNIN